MKRTLISLLMFALPLLAMAQSGTQNPSLDDINKGGFYARRAGSAIRSLPDGKHYSELNRQGSAILRCSYATGQVVDTLFSLSKAREAQFERVQHYIISDNGLHMLLFTDIEGVYRHSFKATVYHYDLRRNLVSALSEEPGKVMIPTFSPDGRMVAFVRDNNIFIKKFDFDTEVQVTNDGEFNKVLNGITDWVYEEEFATDRLISWSQDSKFLAYVRSDESAVKQYGMPMYEGQLYPQDYVYKYPKAGERNSNVSLHIYQVLDRVNKSIDLGISADSYLPRIEFRKQGLAVMTLNRRQNDFRIMAVDPQTLIAKQLFQESNERYIDSDWVQGLKFTPDGGFLYVSEKEGYAHIYQYDMNGVEKRRVTSGSWDVTELYGIDEAGTVYYQSAEESPIRRAIYKVDAKGKKTRLSPGVGLNAAIFSSNFSYFINNFSNSKTPNQTAIYDSKSLKELRVLEDNAALRQKLANHRFADKEFTTVQTASGLELNAWILKPVDFDPNKQYPLLMVQYSGPNSQQVLDRFNFDWEYYLCSEGFIVACVDGRGTGARGEEFRKCTYLELGVKESDDQVAAAKALGALPYIDATRMAIWGWSFGGYNTLMSLCRGNGTFRAGVAVAPVSDWRFYDTIYTERFMRTPQENPAGYKAASAIEHASKMQGDLLIITGSADDNVHLQNTMLFTEALVQANIPFDMAVYTDKNHFINGGNTRVHLYQRMVKFLKEKLLH